MSALGSNPELPVVFTVVQRLPTGVGGVCLRPRGWAGLEQR